MASTILALGTLLAEGSTVYRPPTNNKVVVSKWFFINSSEDDLERVTFGLEKGAATVNLFSGPLKAGWSVDLLDGPLEVDSTVTFKGGEVSSSGKVNYLLLGEVGGQQR